MDVFDNKTNYYHLDKPGKYRFGYTAVGRDRNIGGIDRLMKAGENCYISFFNETAAHEQSQ